jgi:hypothetical protein
VRYYGDHIGQLIHSLQWSLHRSIDGTRVSSDPD